MSPSRCCCLQSGAALAFDAARTLFADNYVNDATGGRSYDVGPDGRFLMLREQGGASDEIQLVVNWFSELPR